jgi:D-lactate dehydrogenase (cytochrome)
MFRREDQDEVNRMKSFSHEMAHRAIQLGGTCTGEHGVGSGKKELLLEEMGLGTMTVAAKIKQAMDPKMILNPDKVIDQQVYQATGTTTSSSTNHRLCS